MLHDIIHLFSDSCRNFSPGKKRNEGKHHNVALSHVAKRLTRIIFYLEKNDTDFDIEKMR